MEIRRATAADLPRVAVLAAGLVRLHHSFDNARFMLPDDIEAGYQWFLGRELDDKQAVVLVAVKSDGIVGYCYGRMEPRNWALLLDRHGELIDIFVDEKTRRSGIARALAEAMIRELENLGAAQVVLGTAVPNEAAQSLFERLGFRRTMIEMTRETTPRNPRKKPTARTPSQRTPTRKQ